MEITLSEISEKFDLLCGDGAAREDVAAFAVRAMEASDLGLLRMEEAHKAAIWGAILYFSGVDLRVQPDEYLHVAADFEDARHRLGV